MKAVLGTAQAGGNLEINLATLRETRLFIQGAPGAGKSYLVRKLCEETYGKVQQILLDVEGEFGSLRSIGDYILVGDDGDLPIDVATAGDLARKLRELRTNAILSVYDLSPQNRQAFVKAFLEALVESPKESWPDTVLVIVDEAQVFAPEVGKGGKKQKDEVSAKAAVEDLCARGRKRGLVAVLATPRIADVSKSAVSACNNKIVGLCGSKGDKKRAADELGFDEREQLQSLGDLERGEYYAKGPAISKTAIRVQIGKCRSKHGTELRTAKDRAPAPTHKVRSVLAKLAALQQQEKQEALDKDGLEKRVRELERQLKAATAGGLPPEKRQELVQQGYEKGKAEVYKLMNQFKNRLKQKLAEIGSIVDQIPENTGTVVQGPPALRTVSKPSSSAPALTMKASIPTRVMAVAGERKLDRCARAILNLLTNRPSEAFSQAQLGGWTEYSVNSSSFANALGALRSAGLIKGSQELMLAVSQAEAIAALGDDYDSNFAPSLEGWKNKLEKAPRTFFTILLANAGHVLTKEQLAELSGYSVTSSSFANAIGELCSKKLAVRDAGGIRLNPELSA